MKAPNGSPTNLTERQWVQVRTPSFKAWFGDWEANALLLAIEQLPSIDVVDREGNIDAVVAYIRLKESRNEIDGRTIRFVNSALGKILRHKGYPAERIVHQLGEIYEKAVPIGFVPEEKREGHKEHRNFVGYHNYVGKIADAGKTYYVRITVQELKTKSKTFNPNEFHSSFISDVELYNETDALALNTAKSAGKVGAVGFVDNIIAKLKDKIKPQNISKVLDKEGIASDIGHGTSRLKSIAFAAVHDVIQNGIVYNRSDNWKNRGWTTAVIAAPIEIGGVGHICEVVIKKLPHRQGFYLHERQGIPKPPAY